MQKSRTVRWSMVFLTLVAWGWPVTRAECQTMRRADRRLMYESEAASAQILYASDAEGYDAFGNVVAVDGDLMVVGAPNADIDGVSYAGSAYIFTRSQLEWGGEMKIFDIGPPVPEENDRFGFQVDISDGQVFVSVPGDLEGANGQAGSVRVFSFDENQDTWTQQQRITAPSPGDRFDLGLSLAVDGDILVACSPGIGPSAEGVCDIFNKVGDSWVWEVMISPPDPVPSQQFGAAVSLYGTTLAVGSPIWYDDELFAIGRVYLFERSGGGWSQGHVIDTPHPQQYGYFGNPVFLSHDTLFVGATGYDHSQVPDDPDPIVNTGTVYVFERSGGGWSPEPTNQILPHPVETTVDWGRSVTLVGDTVVIGDPGATVNDEPTVGEVYTYVPTVDGWQPNEVIAPETLVVGAYFGLSLAASGITLAIGAPYDHTPADVPTEHGGTVYVLDLDPLPSPTVAQVPGPTELTMPDPWRPRHQAATPP